MEKSMSPQCAQCESKECRDGKDCFSKDSNHKQLYQDSDIAELRRAASAIEAKYYGKETRLGEIILFAKELGHKTIGLAFCIGLSEEAKVIENILSKHFEVVSVCCKVCGIDKKDLRTFRLYVNPPAVMRKSSCIWLGNWVAIALM